MIIVGPFQLSYSVLFCLQPFCSADFVVAFYVLG